MLVNGSLARHLRCCCRFPQVNDCGGGDASEHGRDAVPVDASNAPADDPLFSLPVPRWTLAPAARRYLIQSAENYEMSYGGEPREMKLM